MEMTDGCSLLYSKPTFLYSPGEVSLDILTSISVTAYEAVLLVNAKINQ